MNRKVTLYDIAREAGVSGCSVSWILSDDPRSLKMRSETRQRVLETAQKLGYRRNQLASATRTGRTMTIAAILSLPQIHQLAPVNLLIFSGIMLEASHWKYSVKVFSDDDLESAFRSIEENRIDKVVFHSINQEKREQAAVLAEKYSMQLVYSLERGHHGFPAVNVDNTETTCKMVHYLAEHGHRRIGLLCVPHKFHYVQDRHAGYLLGMKECGLAVDPKWICCSDNASESVEKMLRLPADRRPTAYVAAADSLAANAQKAALEHGLRIPEDFSVMGIGDTEIGKYTFRKLTTMNESQLESGKMLVKLLLGQTIGIPDEFNVYHTHAAVVERESVYNINLGGKK